MLSSIASSCDHIAHVRTQIPYAVTTMGAAAVFGYLGSTLFYSPYVGLILGLIVIIVILFIVGSDPEAETNNIKI